MTITPQPGDVWDRNGVHFRVLHVGKLFATLKEVGVEHAIEKWMLLDWDHGWMLLRLIERDGKAVPHG